jgi:hypothetical protein
MPESPLTLSKSKRYGGSEILYFRK